MAHNLHCGLKTCICKGSLEIPRFSNFIWAKEKGNYMQKLLWKSHLKCFNEDLLTFVHLAWVTKFLLSSFLASVWRNNVVSTFTQIQLWDICFYLWVLLLYVICVMQPCHDLPMYNLQLKLVSQKDFHTECPPVRLSPPPALVTTFPSSGSFTLCKPGLGTSHKLSPTKLGLNSRASVLRQYWPC